MPFVRLRWTDTPSATLAGGAITIGNFDGVHPGHHALIQSARALARPTVAVTFDPPPAQFLYPDRATPPLTTLSRRAELLTAAGADAVAVLEVDAGLLSLSPEAFFEDVVVRLFSAVAVAEGYNFRFGRARTGDTHLLKSLCHQARLAFAQVEPQSVAGITVSSSRIRAALTEGDMALATLLLGRPHAVEGVVEQGAQRGRTIGFPTANLGQIATLVPKEGVYAGEAIVDGRRHAAVANLGPAPTFGVAERKLEVHLLDYHGDLYGQPVKFQFIERLRDIRSFQNRDELIHQLQADVQRTRAIFSPAK